tara:strand:+ start:339 stop:776 length:438 start_codon:yes stop_codon:yes gene_type:complete
MANIVPRTNLSDKLGKSGRAWQEVHSNAVVLPVRSDTITDSGTLYRKSDGIYIGSNSLDSLYAPNEWVFENLTVVSDQVNPTMSFTLQNSVATMSNGTVPVRMKVNGIDIPSGSVSLSGTTLTYNSANLYTLETDDTVQVWYIKA